MTLLFCHECNEEWEGDHTATCTFCGSDFIEEVVDEHDDPREFVHADDIPQSGAEGGFSPQDTVPGFAMLQDLLSRIVPNFVSPNATPGESEQAQPPTSETGGGRGQNFQFGRQYTFSFNQNQGMHFASNDIPVDDMPTFLRRAFENGGGGVGDQNQEGGQNPAPLNQLFGQMFGMQGNMGDYVWSQGGLDEIVSRLMEQHTSGNAPPAASETAISHLPMTKVSKECVQQGWDCAVCKDDLVLDEDIISLPCKHVYHPDCIKKWLATSNSCPICRTAVPDVSPNEGSGTGHGDPDAETGTNNTEVPAEPLD